MHKNRKWFWYWGSQCQCVSHRLRMGCSHDYNLMTTSQDGQITKFLGAQHCMKMTQLCWYLGARGSLWFYTFPSLDLWNLKILHSCSSELKIFLMPSCCLTIYKYWHKRKFPDLQVTIFIDSSVSTVKASIANGQMFSCCTWQSHSWCLPGSSWGQDGQRWGKHWRSFSCGWCSSPPGSCGWSRWT